MNLMGKKHLFPTWRWAHKFYAKQHGRFWSPCPICGTYFGLHEQAETGVWRSQSTKSVVCWKCDDTAENLNNSAEEFGGIQTYLSLTDMPIPGTLLSFSKYRYEFLVLLCNYDLQRTWWKTTNGNIANAFGRLKKNLAIPNNRKG